MRRHSTTPTWRRSLPIAGMALAALAGCSPPSGTSDAQGTPDARGAVDQGATGRCAPPGFSGGPMQSVNAVNATITDLAGAPVAGLPVSVTGLDLAFSATTSAAGTAALSPDKVLKAPAFRFGDALTYPRLQVPLRAAVTTLASLVTARLPAAGAPLQAGASATSGDLTITIAPGASVLIDQLSYDTPDKQKLRAVTLPVAKEADITGGLSFDMLIGVAPSGTLFCPPAAVSLPNTPGLPAGTAVDFFVSGDDVGQQWAPFGGWARVSDGQVSADGKTISTVAGGGVPLLANLAVRRKP